MTVRQSRVCDMCSGYEEERSVVPDGSLPAGWYRIVIHVPLQGLQDSKAYTIDVCDKHKAAIEPFLKRYGA